MKILANKKIKELFGKITVCTVIFTLAAVLLTSFEAESVTLVIILCMVGMGAVILIFGYGYFKEQNEVMETAVSQIKEYISGNHEARIDCDEEGEVYRLFHEVNSLVTILNAHVEQERRSKQFLKNTISDISHQLKTPMTSMLVITDTLVQNLLKITKLDAGSIVLEKKPEDVAEMMNNVELRFSYRAEQEQKKLVLFGEEDIFLSCDRDWILEAVDNIVKNAMDHTKSGDTIEIKWRKSASIVQIQIKDNGSGIHPEDLHHIFKRFYRSRFSKDQQGIGLGLPLAKMIIEAHNGTIEVNSELGKGTMFTISFLIPIKL